jgi:hypothetical protein
MPKIEITTKFSKGDQVYFIFQNGIVKGTITSVTVYAAWGRDEDPRCSHQQLDDKWIEIGEEPVEPLAPTIEYHIELDHPVVTEIGKGKKVLEKVYGNSRLFRSPSALLAYLKRKFSQAYGEEIKDYGNPA